MNKIFDIFDYRINKFLINATYNYLSYDEKDEETDLYKENWDNEIDLKKSIEKKNSIKISISLSSNEKLRLFSEKMKNIKRNLERQVENYISNIELSKNLNQNLEILNNFNFSFEIEDNIVNFISKQDSKFTKNLCSSYDINQKKYPFLTNEKNTKNLKEFSFSSKFSKDILLAKYKNHLSRNLNVFDFYSTNNNVHDELISSGYLTKNLNFKEGLSNFINQDRKDVQSEVDNLSIFEKIKYFSSLPITSETHNELLIESGCLFIGFLVRKHIKKKDGSLSLNAANQFIHFDIINDYNKEEIVFYDDYVSYGCSYCYEIFPVFCVILPKNLDGYYEKQYALICNQSYKTLFTRAVEYLQPSPPNALHAKFIYNLNKIEFLWDNPNNPTNDVIGYQLYRRKSLEEPYTLIYTSYKKDPSKFRNFDMFSDTVSNEVIKDFDRSGKFAKTNFIDEIDNLNSLYIYTVCSVDAHGFVSNYSNQIAVRYSNVYNKLIVDNISLSDAPRQYPNLYVKRKTMLFENDNLIFNFTPFFKNKEKIKIFFTPDCLNLKTENGLIDILNINNDIKYQLNLIRLTDLKTKTIKFSLN